MMHTLSKIIIKTPMLNCSTLDIVKVSLLTFMTFHPNHVFWWWQFATTPFADGHWDEPFADGGLKGYKPLNFLIWKVKGGRAKRVDLSSDVQLANLDFLATINFEISIRSLG